MVGITVHNINTLLLIQSQLNFNTKASIVDTEVEALRLLMAADSL